MSDSPRYAVILFASTGHALMGEKIARELGLTCKLIPVPRHLSSDCGICLRVHSDDAPSLEAAMSGRIEWTEICRL